MGGRIVRPALIALLLALADPVVAAGAAENTSANPTKTYLDGLIAGEAQGLEEGRALEIGQALPADERTAIEAAFKAGYAAGANDAFGSYDGGWRMHVPYAVWLAPDAGPITYRIENRVPLEPGVAYSLCPDGHSLCQVARK